MTKRDLFEELKVIRTAAEKGACNSYIVDQLQELIWEIGQDIGEF